MAKVVCPYCKADFLAKSELTLHLAHAHGIYSESYYQVLQDREKSGYYVRSISYWKKKG